VGAVTYLTFSEVRGLRNMLRLGLFISAAAFISATAASAAPAPNFSGSSSGSSSGRYPHVLSVTFTEIGIGSHPASYKLEATAEFQTSGCDRVPTIERVHASSETGSPIVPERGRASGELAAVFWPLGSPGCPALEPNEDGYYPPATPVATVFLGWIDITVTSSSGRVLRLPDRSATASG
jgi:hypothetical protein